MDFPPSVNFSFTPSRPTIKTLRRWLSEVLRQPPSATSSIGDRLQPERTITNFLRKLLILVPSLASCRQIRTSRDPKTPSPVAAKGKFRPSSAVPFQQHPVIAFVIRRAINEFVDAIAVAIDHAFDWKVIDVNKANQSAPLRFCAMLTSAL